MADDKKATNGRQSNPEAEAKNWEQRLHTELEAPHKWREAWGSLFDNGVPLEYNARIKYLEEELKKLPNERRLPKYGLGQPIKEMGFGDYRRKKMFYEGELDLDS